MIDIQVQQVSKYYGAKKVFSQITFVIMSQERVGLIGCNGCGKTTLLRMLQGSESWQTGTIQIRRGLRIGCLEQFMRADPTETVMTFCQGAFAQAHAVAGQLRELEHELTHETGVTLDRLLTRYGELSERYELLHGYDAETRIEQVLQGLDVAPDLRQRCFGSLSGGEQTRIAMARLLLEEPDLLLLDEPSNHLDLAAIEWLEAYLTSCTSTVVTVSHDRTLLDRTVTRIIELHDDRADSYPGNYSAAVAEKERRYQLAMHAYENQQKTIARMERQIERYKIWGAMRDSETMERAAKVLERKLAKVERLDLPRIDNPKTRLDTSSRRRSGNEVLQIEDLRYAPGNKPLLGAIKLKLFYQDRACLLGANGSGKTTLLRLVLGELKPEQGRIRLGASLTIGYLPQVIRFAEEERTVLDYFCRRHDIGQGEARTLLARALFSRDEVFKQLSSLSGGERSRLLLLSLCLDQPNFLIMDEPTNHLDIDSRENLEELLQRYDGTLLFVSHDRTFIRKIADRILVLEAGQLTDHAMDYDTYRQYSQTSAPTQPALPVKDRPMRPSTRAAPAELAESQDGAKIAIDQLEAGIAQLEAELSRIEAAMQKEAFQAEPLLALHQEMEACAQKRDRLMRQWLDLQD